MRSFFALSLLLFSGCNAPFSNDDLLFLLSAPVGLRVEVPAPAGTSPGVPAQFYRETRQAAEAVNAEVFAFVDLVGAVTEQPPSARTEDRRIWGPFDPGDGVELLLVVDRIETSTTIAFTSASPPVTLRQIFDMVLLARPAGGSDADYRGIFLGRSAPQVGGTHGGGRLVVDLEAAQALYPTAGWGGRIAMSYDTRGDETLVEVAADEDGTGGFVPESTWQHRQEASGAGRFLYAYYADLVKTTETLELVAVAARWLADDRGRADVLVTQGDVGAGYYFASECWDAEFEQVFLLANIPGPEFTPVGSVAACGPELLSSQFP